MGSSTVGRGLLAKMETPLGTQSPPRWGPGGLDRHSGPAWGGKQLTLAFLAFARLGLRLRALCVGPRLEEPSLSYCPAGAPVSSTPLTRACSSLGPLRLNPVPEVHTLGGPLGSLLVGDAAGGGKL